MNTNNSDTAKIFIYRPAAIKNRGIHRISKSLNIKTRKAYSDGLERFREC